MIRLVFALHLLLSAGVPLDLGAELFDAAEVEGVDRYDLAATLISEHHGDYTPRTSPTGAEGVWQLRPQWGIEWGGTRASVHDPAERSRVAAWVISYSIERHAGCSGDHHWVAHWKCGPGGRDDCAGPVRRWKRIRRGL